MSDYEYKEESKAAEEKDEAEYAYKTVIEKGTKSRSWSAAALIFGIISILCCYFYTFAIIAGLAAIAFSFISRRNLGYYDNLSIAGIITAIFGVVFSIAMIIVIHVIKLQIF